MKYESIRDVALDAVLKTRFSNEKEVADRYIRICEKSDILPLWGQLRESLLWLRENGKIVYKKGQGIKRVK